MRSTVCFLFFYPEYSDIHKTVLKLSFLIKYTCMDQKYSNVTLLQLYWKTSQKVFEISWSLWCSLCFKKNTPSLTVFCPHEEFGLMKLNCSCSLQKSMGSVIKYLVVLEVIIVSLNSSFEDHKKMTNEIFYVSGSVSASQPGQMLLFQLVLRHNAT